MIHLHWHSHYSLLEATWNPWKIVEKAKELGMSAIAVTDYHGMYWSIEFYENAEKNWIKPILWTELFLSLDLQNKHEKTTPQNIVLIAKNIDWYQNLLKLVSFAHTTWYNQKPRIDFETLQTFSKWLIWIVWWENSFLGSMILSWEEDKKIEDITKKLNEIFEWEVYYEIMAQDETKLKETKKINQKLIEIASSNWTQLIIWNDYSYPEKTDKKAYEVLLCIKENQKYTKSFIQWDYHIKSEEEIRKIMKKNNYDEESINKMIENNHKVSEKIDLQLPLWQILFPKYQSDEDIKKLYEIHKNDLITN